MREMRISDRFVVAIVPVDECELLDKNARFMRSETFQRLKANIERDGQLSQLPFCLKVAPNRYRVLSGNHRVKAAKSAGLTEIPIIYTDQEMSRQEQVAVQLSHNAIAGEDDPVLLKELFEELTQVSERVYAGLDDKTLGLLAKVNLAALSDVRLDFRTISFLFLPEECDNLKDVLAAGLEMVKGQDVYLARLASFDQLLDALAKTQAAYKVGNAATALMVFLELYRRRLTDLEDGWYDAATDEPKHKGFVPLASVFGTENIPADVAVVVRRAIESLIASEGIEPARRWQALEKMAADFLAGARL